MVKMHRVGACTAAVLVLVMSPAVAQKGESEQDVRAHLSKQMPVVTYHTVEVNGVNVFYREAGPRDAPAILLLHGFPTSSFMFRNLIPRLADRYHVIAPDYPGFGQSGMPPMDKFTYSFDNLALTVDKLTQQLGLQRFAMYVQDYGAPIGYRIAAAHPERISAIIVQNGNAYNEGIDNPFWEPFKAYWRHKTPANAAPLRALLDLNTTRAQYTTGVGDLTRLTPDTWTLDQVYLDRPGNKDIQVELFYSYGSNPPHYPEWQAYFRRYQPPMLIVWGKNDFIFPPAGAAPYLRDLPKAKIHYINTGHFALEEKIDEMAPLIRSFLRRHLGDEAGR
jgi:pimeloyl-ACP methyl ester carboxylesterase